MTPFLEHQKNQAVEAAPTDNSPDWIKEISRHERNAIQEIKQRVEETSSNETTVSWENIKYPENTDDLIEMLVFLSRVTKETIGMVPFEAQLLALLRLEKPNTIAEIKTGEGKTLITVLLAAIKSKKHSVHVMTSNPYLAQRDAQDMSRFYSKLGISVGYLIEDPRQATDFMQFNPDTGEFEAVDRSEGYKTCQIIYGTPSEFAFDHLRATKSDKPTKFNPQNTACAIFDEVDAVNDRSLSPFVTSELSLATNEEFVSQVKMNNAVRNACMEMVPIDHYYIDLDTNQVVLTPAGSRFLEEKFLSHIGGKTGESTFGALSLGYIPDNNPSESWSNEKKEMHEQITEVELRIIKRLLKIFDIRKGILSRDSKKINDRIQAFISNEASPEIAKDNLERLLDKLYKHYSNAPDSQESTPTFNVTSNTFNPLQAVNLMQLFMQDHSKLNTYQSGFSNEGIQPNDFLIEDQEPAGPEKAALQNKIQQMIFILHSLLGALMLQEGEDYLIDDNEIVLIDSKTGRKNLGSQLVDLALGLAIKEMNYNGILPRPSSDQVTVVDLFSRYQEVSGMSGTVWTLEDHLYKQLGLETSVIPTQKPVRRVDHPIQLRETRQSMIDEIVRVVRDKLANKEPVLIVCQNIPLAEELYAAMSTKFSDPDSNDDKKHIEEVETGFSKLDSPIQLLTARTDLAEEARIISRAGNPAQLTIASPMAGRGTDIKLPIKPADAVAQKGLVVIAIGANSRLTSRDLFQIWGRSGRQGDPGESHTYIPLDDPIWNISYLREFHRKILATKDPVKRAGLMRAALKRNEEELNYTQETNQKYSKILSVYRKQYLKTLGLIEKHNAFTIKPRSPETIVTQSKESLLKKAQDCWTQFYQEYVGLETGIRLMLAPEPEKLRMLHRESADLFESLFVQRLKP